MKKKLHGFSYYRNIANFEAFWQDKNFSKNLLFLGSVLVLGFQKIFYYSSYHLIAGGMEDYKSYIIVERVPNFSLPMFIMT